MLYQIRQLYDTPPLQDALPVFKNGGEGYHAMVDFMKDLEKSCVNF